MNASPTHLYVGRRERVIAEMGGLQYLYAGKYLASPYGEPDFDSEGASSKKELKALIEEYRRAYPGIIICWV